MMDFICAIPEEIGWVMVGALAAYCVMWAHKVGKLLVQMWKDYHEECEG